MALYRPNATTGLVSTVQWQTAPDDGSTTPTWTNTSTPPSTSDDIFLNGCTLTVDANLSFKTLRNTASYNRLQGASMVTLTNISTATTAKLIFTTTGVTLTGASGVSVDTDKDDCNCLAGGTANALMDNTGAGVISLNFNNVRIKAGTAATHHGFNMVSTSAITFNLTNLCRFQGATSTAACHGFNAALTNANMTFSGDVEFRGGNFASSFGATFPNAATLKINNTAGTQVRMLGGGATSSHGVNISASMNVITIGDITSSDLNFYIKAGSGTTSNGLNVVSQTGTVTANIGVPSSSANTVTLAESSSTSPAIIWTSTAKDLTVVRGTLKASVAWQPIVTQSRLFVLGSNAVLFEYPSTPSTISSFTTNATVSNVTEASIWTYATRTLTAATNITSDGGTISQTQLGRLDATVSSRLATSVYTAPDNTTISTINTNVSAIKTKTDNLPTNTTTEFSTINTKLDTIDDYIDTEIAAIKTATDRIPTNPASVQSTGDQIATLQ